MTDEGTIEDVRRSQRELRAELVDLQASLMRRWVKATAEWRRGDCTDVEYEDYLKVLRGIAAKASAGFCPMHGRPAGARAAAWAAPIRLGVMGCGLGDYSAKLHDVDVPKRGAVSTWTFIPGFGPDADGYFSRKSDSKISQGNKLLHPTTLKVKR